ncbi:helix-turn-helix domain-containing protein [Caulobacter sp. NIBR2454]|uniref:helix-turn-helix domain-containing protein n=1 Tax=Caulobacter sp. NIBR2454 TaxID=3015996 RepID=UPI003FA478E0
MTQARLEKRVTQVELAERLSRPQSYVSKYERGERRIDVIEFCDIARALDFDPIQLLRSVLEAGRSRA